MKSEIEKLSYSVGVNIGLSMKPQGLGNVDTDLLAAGITDAIKENDFKIDQDEIRSILDGHFQKMQAEGKRRAEEAQKEALEAQKAFFTENGKNDGVTTTESGLQYQVMNEGDGPKPKIDSKVTTHYHGTTLDGEVFDSSVQRGEPISFAVNGVIPGWTEALQMMNVGSKWKLFIPSNLAYGERGAGDRIPPHTPLVFEVELLGFE